MVKKPKSKILTVLLISFVVILILLVVSLSGVFEQQTTTTTTIRTTVPTTVPTTVETTIETTVETTTIATTSIQYVEHQCNLVGYKIMSYSYKNEILTFYLKNTGSVHIYNFVAILAYPDNIEEKSFLDIDIEPKEIARFTTDVLTNLDNVTVYVPGCSYNIIDHLFNV